MFNRREQQALVGLAAAMLVGSVAAVGDWLRPGALEEFRVVPRAVQPPPVLELALAEPAPIPLNSATATELVALPAVGPKTAALIVAHRREHGAFARLEQLLAIKGIGRKTLDKLRPLVTLD